MLDVCDAGAKMINKFKKSIYWKTLKTAEKRWLLNIFVSVLAIGVLYFGLLGARYLIDTSGIVEVMNAREDILSSFSMEASNIGEQEMIGFTAELLKAVNRVLFVILLLALYSIIIYSIAKYHIYKIIYKKRFRKTTFWKYLLFNIITISLFCVSFYYILITIKKGAAVIVVPLLTFFALYFFTFFNILFFKEEKVFKTIKLIYFLTITKLHRLLAAFGWISLNFFAASIIIYPILLIPKAGAWLSLIPLLLWCMFNRYYLINVLESKDILPTHLKRVK
jgi:hypothetical protein